MPWFRLQLELPLCRFLSLRADFHFRAKFTYVSKIEVMSERSRLNVQVERGSSLTFTCDSSYIAAKFSAYATVEICLYYQASSDLNGQVLLSRSRRFC